MPQLVKKRRSGWAVLAAGALVASLLAVGASPAAAQANMPDHRPEVPPNWSACVGAAGAHDAMFTDVSDGHAFSDAIDCIAYYGITLGMGDGTYAPNEHVTAFEMGLFVQRTADLMGADGEAVLGDVTLSDTVTRLQMAQLMFGLLDDMLDWVRINRDGDIQFDRDEDNRWVEVNDYFADALDDVPIAESELIGATFELGVVRGTGAADVSTKDSKFLPGKEVTRGEMAAFITRALDHSNLRPAGLAAQRNLRKDTQVSTRDADFQPIEDARIDAFSSLYPVDAFDDDGECVARFVRDESESDDACEVSLLDELTDDDGNVEFTLLSDVAPVALVCTVTDENGAPVNDAQNNAVTVSHTFGTAEGPDKRTNWVWTGDIDDEVDEDTDLVELEDVNRPLAGDPPDHAHITGGLPTGGELAKMGETVTFTVQMRTGGSDPQPTGPDRSGNPFQLRITKHFVASAATAGSPTADDISAVPGEWNYLEVDPRTDGVNVDTRDPVNSAGEAQFQTPFDSLVWPNGDGAFTITLTNMDLNVEKNGTDVAVRFELTPFLQDNDLVDSNLVTNITGSGNYAEGNSLPADLSAEGYVVFSDDASRATSITGASAADYRIINSDGTGNGLTVTVTDQYGDPLRNIGITVRSDLDSADTDGDQVRYPEAVDITVEDDETVDASSTIDTRRNGTARIGYSYTATVVQTEMVTPTVVAVVDNLDTTDIDEAMDAIVGDAVTVYFVKVGNTTESHTDDEDAGDPEDVEIFVTDVSRRAIVVNEGADDGDNPMVYYYDEHDTFIVKSDGDISDIPATMEMFEEALGLTDGEDGLHPGRIQWESYDFDTPRDRAIWELTMICERSSES